MNRSRTRVAKPDDANSLVRGARKRKGVEH